MKCAARLCLGATVGLWLTAAPASAQAVTGPPTDAKLNGAVDAGPWSADETVARLVHDPIKILGMGRFSPGGRIALKGHMERAESRVRAVMARLSNGAIDQSEARSELADAIAEYRLAVRESLAAR